MQLFDDIIRERLSPQKENEPIFSFLNNSGRDSCEKLRLLLQKWFDLYPKKCQKDLWSRLRSKKNHVWQAAYSELLLHQVHKARNVDISLHPPTNGEESPRPDFLIESADELSYLEVCVATGESDKDRAAQSRMNEVVDIINSLENDRYFIFMHDQGEPKTSPPAKEIKEFLRSKIDELNHEEMVELSKNPDSIPEWHFDHDGWFLTFKPFPVSNENPSANKRGKRLIGARGPYTEMDNTSESIKTAVMKKANHYKNINHPFVVAVNVMDMIDNTDIMEALFGDEEHIFSRSGSMHTVKRRRNGAFTEGDGPRNTSISAVLIMENVCLWTIDRTKTILVHNPWAQKPYNGLLTEFPQKVPQESDQTMKYLPGKSFAEVMGCSDELISVDFFKD